MITIVLHRCGCTSAQPVPHDWQVASFEAACRCCRQPDHRWLVEDTVASRRAAVDPGDPAAPNGPSRSRLGAPVLSSVSLSVAHAPGAHATAVASDGLGIGIDLEPVERQLGPLPARSATGLGFTSGELAAVAAGLPPVALLGLREAAGKYLGVGLLGRWDVYDPQEIDSDGPGRWRASYAAWPFLVGIVRIVDDRWVVCAVSEAEAAAQLSEALECVDRSANGCPEFSACQGS